MTPRLLAPLLAFAARLRFPTLFKLTLTLMLISWLWPFDPLPLVDEIVTALATLLLASWKRSRSEPGNPPIAAVQPASKQASPTNDRPDAGPVR